MKLDQALRFSELSSVRVDGCTLAPELGVKVYCNMHDHLLIHLASKTHGMGMSQVLFLSENGLSNEMTRHQADRLFRDGLAEKVEKTDGLRKTGYWVVKWVYYSFVRARSIVFG